MAEPKKKGFGELINITSDAFGASTNEPEIPYPRTAFHDQTGPLPGAFYAAV